MGLLSFLYAQRINRMKTYCCIPEVKQSLGYKIYQFDCKIDLNEFMDASKNWEIRKKHYNFVMVNGKWLLVVEE